MNRTTTPSAESRRRPARARSLRPLAAALALSFGNGVATLPPTVAASALGALATGARGAAAQIPATCIGAPTAECTDVPVDGIRYTSGVDTVNVRDGVAEPTVVHPGTIGIELSRSGAHAPAAPDVAFGTIAWDADGDPITPQIDVGATHYFPGTHPRVHAQFEGAPVGVAPFAVTGAIDENYVDLAAGVGLLDRNGKVLRVTYTGQFGSRTKTNALALKVSVPF